MLVPIEQLANQVVFSLQTGAELAKISLPIIDPRKLTIAAFYVNGSNLTHQMSVLHPSDIREINDLGIIVDDESKLMGMDGLTRLNEIIGFKFNIIGMKVVDTSGRKLGKISDYSIEQENFSIQQLTTEQSILRSFSTAGNLIRRNQIVAIDAKQITVDIPSVRSAVTDAANSIATNPFK